MLSFYKRYTWGAMVLLKIELKYDHGIPQYACNSCGSCSSVFGRSLCAVKNRGCCWYFPKFTLHEIHKMSKSQEGLDTLKTIISVPKVEIYHYYIHAAGNFDKVNYKKYLESEQSLYDRVEDKTIFFRTCPFVKQGYGCTIAKKYRSYICNFFICDEIVKKVKKYDIYNKYIEQRESYVRWIDWENVSLKILLEDKGLNLINNFDEVIKLLNEEPLELDEFEQLPAIEIPDF